MGSETNGRNQWGQETNGTNGVSID